MIWYFVVFIFCFDFVFFSLFFQLLGTLIPKYEYAKSEFVINGELTISPKIFNRSKLGLRGGNFFFYSDFHGYNIPNNDI